ncbi:PASTA domain-containing protein [Mycolicibacterium sp.]|uniref:PASTA domain-containing protein n=1 Tax=Mycolicibacterium sp. TaxID=2320850 RepID=UPI001A1F0163|nr:PASTA domain-containing protein [Mycolicibacterium sp.]MBJ7341759.1 PASTA domain-containing protein [Mycolicibacterium sp.]
MRNLAGGTVLGATAVSAMFLFGAGVAHAGSTPDVVGQKYSDAQTAISGAGLTAVVSTTVGDQLARPDCMVTNTVARTVPAPENSSGSATNQVLVSLNCEASEASATKPGFSAASPEGRAAAAAAASSAAAATPAPSA